MNHLFLIMTVIFMMTVFPIFLSLLTEVILDFNQSVKVQMQQQFDDLVGLTDVTPTKLI